jgi:hypothetical protein
MKIRSERKMAASPNFGSGEWWNQAPSGPPSQEFWNNWQQALYEENLRLARLLESGAIDPEEWAIQTFAVVEDGHGLSWMLGRQRAGELEAYSEADQTVGIIASQFDAPYLLRFRQALENKDPRYWDAEAAAWRPEAIAGRADMYAQRLRGTAGWGWEQSLPGESEIAWVMTKIEHCPDCPEMAADGPYLPGELSIMPGEGRTACKMNCGCRLESTGFEPSFERP